MPVALHCIFERDIHLFDQIKYSNDVKLVGKLSVCPHVALFIVKVNRSFSI